MLEVANAARGTHNEHTHFCSFGICLRLKFIYISVLERLIAEMWCFSHLLSSVDAGRSGLSLIQCQRWKLGTEKTIFFFAWCSWMDFG